MASMQDIKRRKASIQSTEQITKAMKLVSTVKLQKARERAEEVQPYFTYMYQTVISLLARSENIDHPYLKAGASEKKAVAVISSNRGLAGGYNAGIVRLLTGDSKLPKGDVEIYAVGSKGVESLGRKGYHIAADYSRSLDDPSYEEASKISEALLAAFTAGEVGEIYLAYTHFKNTVSQIPTLLKLLPVDVQDVQAEGVNMHVGAKDTGGWTKDVPDEADDDDPNLQMNYEPSEEEVLNMIIPKYVSSLLYGALMDSIASENGARMRAMDSATKNAEDMISALSLQYNRARQASITQELTEIIAGSEAIS